MVKVCFRVGPQFIRIEQYNSCFFIMIPVVTRFVASSYFLSSSLRVIMILFCTYSWLILSSILNVKIDILMRLAIFAAYFATYDLHFH